jgi:hypothetical protein
VEGTGLVPVDEASHNRVVFWNTGVSSLGERLMTLRTSAVAVRGSKASRVSEISHAVSVAVDARRFFSPIHFQKFKI